MTQRDTFSDGDMAGAYEIQELLGAGGHSEVYRGVSPKGEQVAVKSLRETVRGTLKLQERFLSEARVLRELDNPHIVRFLDFGVTPEGVPWLVMELLDGILLRDYLHDRGGRLDIDTAFLFARQLARAADHAHQHNVVHRDLKPENVMVLPGSVVKVFDFGIAKLRGWGNKTTLPGERCGTPLYMAPEQIDGDETDARTDVFAIGVILYECLAGRHPFDNKDGVPPTLEQLRERHRRGARPLPEVLPGFEPYLWDVVAKAIHPDPACRFRDAGALTEALGRALKQWRRAHRRTTSALPSGPRVTPPAVTPAPSPPPASGEEARGAAYAKTVPVQADAPAPDPRPLDAWSRRSEHATTVPLSPQPEEPAPVDHAPRSFAVSRPPPRRVPGVAWRAAPARPRPSAPAAPPPAPAPRAALSLPTWFLKVVVVFITFWSFFGLLSLIDARLGERAKPAGATMEKK